MDKAELDKLQECDLIINHVNTRLRQGLNTNIYVIGLSGTGKSSTSQRLGELIIGSREEKFKVFIIDSLIELLRVLKKTNAGDIVIIEEVSVLFPSRRAMASENVAISKVLDTCRKKELCIISNAPLWISIDSHMRAMGNLLIETLSINKTLKIVHSKFHRLQTDPRTGKTYTHTMLRKDREVKLMFTRMPNIDKWNEYEKRKDKSMEDLYQRLENQQLKKEKKEIKDSRSFSDDVSSLNEQEKEVHYLYNMKGMTQMEVADKIGCSQSKIARITQNILKKLEITKGIKQMGNKPNRGCL